MSRSTFPTTIESLTRDWLTRMLRVDGVIQGGAVRGFSVEPLDGGYTSSLYRLLLEYAGDSGIAPQSLVVKFHGSSVATRARFEDLAIFEKEVRFYQTLAQDHTLPVPICYASEFDPESGDFVLLLEDLSAARPASWEDDGIGDVRTALVHLAEIHGKFWGDPRLQQYDWIVHSTDLGNPPPLKALWAANLAHAKKHYRDDFSDDLWSVFDNWLENWDEIMMCMNQDTHTLVHTDAHLGQMFFPTPESPRFVLFDWQYPSKAWGAEDVAYLIVNELDTEVRRAHEESLLDLYYDELCQQGVSNLGKERFRFQCKLSLLWLHFMYLNTLAEPDLLQTLKAEAREAGDDWREWIFDQLEAATDDWKLAEIVDQAIDEVRYGKS